MEGETAKPGVHPLSFLKRRLSYQIRVGVAGFAVILFQFRFKPISLNNQKKPNTTPELGTLKGAGP